MARAVNYMCAGAQVPVGVRNEKMNVGDANLQPLRVLGQGTFGRVFLCQERNHTKESYVCVKRIIVQNPKVEMKMILEEVYIVSQLKHPRIVSFIRSFVHAGTVNIVMEYAPNGTIRDVLNALRPGTGGLPKSTVLRYFLDVLMGLEYLHIRNVFHRDLKPENLLLDAQDHIKITDFGISTVHTPSKRQPNAVGTPYYMSPELLRGEKFDHKSDIWALGCILYELCMGETPFQQAHNIQQLRFYIRERTRPKVCCEAIALHYGHIWARMCELMLTFDPIKRISLPDILCMDAAITIPFYHKYFDYKY